MSSRKVCAICGWRGKLTKHHKLKKFVFPELKNNKDNIVYVCRTPCHDAIEKIVSQKENALLREHKQEIYLDTLQDFLDGKIDPFEVMKDDYRGKRIRKGS